MRPFLRGRFIPSAKNYLAKSYYLIMFVERNGVYSLAVNKRLRVPAHIVLELEPTPAFRNKSPAQSFVARLTGVVKRITHVPENILAVVCWSKIGPGEARQILVTLVWQG